MKKLPVIAILLGDYAGVGPEIVVKLANNKQLEKYCKPVIIGSEKIFEKTSKELGFSIKYELVKEIDENKEGIQFINIDFCDYENFKLGNLNESCGKACIEMIEKSVELYKSKKIKGVAIAPLNKAAMKMAGLEVESELEFFGKLLNNKNCICEVNTLENVWTFRVTSHIPLKDVSKNLSIEKILQMIELSNRTLKSYGIKKPKIAVSALNPHAGESSLCGTEERDIITPAINIAIENGIDVFGPIPSDIVFIKAFNKEYDAVVTMFHDQGQIALKLRGFEDGITIFGGLDMPITTTGHGSAYDIASKNIAKTSSFLNALKMVSLD